MVLELTLKHVKALSTLLEQQQQKIIALQNDLQISEFVIMGRGPRIRSNSRGNCASELISKCRSNLPR